MGLQPIESGRLSNEWSGAVKSWQLNLQYGDADIAISAIWDYVDSLHHTLETTEARLKFLCDEWEKDKDGNDTIIHTNADQEEAFQEAPCPQEACEEI